MKRNLIIIGFISVIIFGCSKKIDLNYPMQKSESISSLPHMDYISNGGNNRQLTEANGVYQLVDIGNGYYQCNYSNQGNVTLKISNVVYQVYDANGTLMSARNGDPARGTLSVVSTPETNVTIQPDQNGHFSLSQVIASFTSIMPNYANFNAAEQIYITDYSKWIADRNAWINAGHDPNNFTPESPQAPYIQNFLTTTTVGSNAVIAITGRLMRDSIGSQLALAREDYPLPLPPAPLPYPVNKTSISLSTSSSITGGIKTVTLVDNNTISNYIPTFIFQLTSTNTLYQVNGIYKVNSSYSGITWSQFTELFPNVVTNTTAHTISFGLTGKFTSSQISNSPLAIYVTYNYQTGVATISYNNTNYLNYWKNTAQ